MGALAADVEVALMDLDQEHGSMLVLAQEEWMNIVLGNQLDHPRGHWKARHRHHLVGLPRMHAV